jgi:hypothetical protein
MNKREFNKHLNSCRGKNKAFSPLKLRLLPNDVREGMARFIVKHRGPLLVLLLTPSIDKSWLASCGYLYRTKSRNGLEFLHTCEHTIR